MKKAKSSKSLTLKSTLNPGESQEELVAKMMVESVAMNAVTAVVFSKTLGELDLTEVMVALTNEARRVRSGELGRLEEMLAAQAVVLNAMFTSLAYRTSTMTIVDQIDRFIRLSLKAQGQCRATVETLALMKNPTAGAVFARQANIANGPQQVNNGAMPAAAASIPARVGNLETAPIRLLEANDERLDPAKASGSGERDQALATVGAFDRPKNGRRKGPRGS